MDPSRLLGGTDSAPGQPPQVPTVCLWSLMLFDVLAVSSVLSVPRVCLELTPRTTRTKQALSHGRRSSFIVRPFVRCSSAGRSRPVSSYLSSIVYLASYAPYAPYAPYGPGCLPGLPTAHPSAADIADRLSTSTSTSTSAPARRISGAQGYHDTGEEKTGGRPGSGREREGEKARAKGRRMEKEDTGRGIREGERGPRAVITELTLRGRRAQEIGWLFESSRPG